MWNPFRCTCLWHLSTGVECCQFQRRIQLFFLSHRYLIINHIIMINYWVPKQRSAFVCFVNLLALTNLLRLFVIAHFLLKVRLLLCVLSLVTRVLGASSKDEAKDWFQAGRPFRPIYQGFKGYLRARQAEPQSGWFQWWKRKETTDRQTDVLLMSMGCGFASCFDNATAAAATAIDCNWKIRLAPEQTCEFLAIVLACWTTNCDTDSLKTLLMVGDRVKDKCMTSAVGDKRWVNPVLAASTEGRHSNRTSSCSNYNKSPSSSSSSSSSSCLFWAAYGPCKHKTHIHIHT